MRQKPTCDLCSEPLNFARVVHTFQTDAHELDVHSDCAMQLFTGVWDEMELQHAQGTLAVESLLEPREEEMAALVGVKKAVTDAVATIDTAELLESAHGKLVHKAASPLVRKSGRGGKCGVPYETYYLVTYPDGKELCMHPETAAERGIV